MISKKIENPSIYKLGNFIQESILREENKHILSINGFEFDESDEKINGETEAYSTYNIFIDKSNKILWFLSIKKKMLMVLIN